MAREKIGDLTLSKCREICDNSNSCSECPLSIIPDILIDCPIIGMHDKLLKREVEIDGKI